ncbi:hypothetical protein K438DRAFT_1836038 [Mycena galopus ATCC 62051]|nr:hypothetical protein K438DRAFT_1836038 [Mycena galopus ATCC 62051]
MRPLLPLVYNMRVGLLARWILLTSLTQWIIIPHGDGQAIIPVPKDGSSTLRYLSASSINTGTAITVSPFPGSLLGRDMDHLPDFGLPSGRPRCCHHNPARPCGTMDGSGLLAPLQEHRPENAGPVGRVDDPQYERCSLPVLRVTAAVLAPPVPTVSVFLVNPRAQGSSRAQARLLSRDWKSLYKYAFVVLSEKCSEV